MIKLEIDGEVYTEKEFQRDLKRYLNTLDKGKATCNSYENCERCMFFNNGLCGEQYVRAVPINYSFKIIEKVYNWSKEHPVVTNRKKLKEIFGEEKAKEIISRIMFYANNEDFGEWLNEEYKEPGKDKQNG